MVDGTDPCCGVSADWDNTGGIGSTVVALFSVALFSTALIGVALFSTALIAAALMAASLLAASLFACSMDWGLKKVTFFSSFFSSSF